MRSLSLFVARLALRSPLPLPRRVLTPRNLTHCFLRSNARTKVNLSYSTPNVQQAGSIMDKSTLSHTQSVDQLAEALKAIGISEVPKQPNTYPELNPVDIYRSHVAELLAPLTGVDSKIIYGALQWPQTLAMGDLVLAVPALRLKGKKPNELAQELGEKVIVLAPHGGNPLNITL